MISLLQQAGEEVPHDPAFAEDIVSEVQVPGIDRVGNGEAEYLVLVKTRLKKQCGASRELRRRIKESFQKTKFRRRGRGECTGWIRGQRTSLEARRNCS